jgi:predicted flap endonuclease-1-like 5' DNA nuclease
MSTVAEANIVPIIIAVLIGIVVGWWIFRHMRSEAPDAPSPRLSEVARETDGAEGNAVTDQAAAAISDVAGEILQVPTHEELPGASGPPDNLQTLKGVGPKLASQLNELGISRFDQLASLSPSQAASIDERLGTFKGRLARDRVVEQAGYLARDDRAGFEAAFGKLGGSA